MEYIIDEIKKLKIDEKLKDILLYENTNESSLEWGMNYITFSPSKRIRPLLLLESNLIFSELNNDSFLLASSLELIHTYSLVHDDLPCMDNDDLRRGVKTLHLLKNEAYALLVGDALLTRSFGLLSKYSNSQKLPLILKYFNDKSGKDGMILGQILDMEGEGKTLSIEEINNINKFKTGKLLELSLILGAVNGGAEENQIKILEELGKIFGYIFQLQDDILDIVGNNQELGKNTGSDKKNNKSSIPLIIGIEKSKEIILSYKKEAEILINKLPSNKIFFNNFLNFLITRKK